LSHSPVQRRDAVGGSQADDLFQKLRALRKRLADERRVPAYFIFSDATLLEMASARPRTEEELSRVSGVGPKKLEQYAEAFLDVLKN
jgi:ATP-dependent DNA helicase RecQ